MFYRPHNRLPAPSGGPMMTKQEHAAECDIHNILGQYRRTGVIDHIARHRPEYEDLPDPVDFQTALEQVMAAQASFDGLPAKMRAAFDNDPARFLAALGDETRREEFEDLGILKPRRPPPDQAASDPPKA